MTRNQCQRKQNRLRHTLKGVITALALPIKHYSRLHRDIREEDDLKHVQEKQVCAEPRPSPLNMTLPTQSHIYCWVQAAGIPAINWYLLQMSVLSSKPTSHCCCQSMGQMDTDPTITQTACYAGSVNNMEKACGQRASGTTIEVAAQLDWKQASTASASLKATRHSTGIVIICLHKNRSQTVNNKSHILQET